jgi:hypothetical protein
LRNGLKFGEQADHFDIERAHRVKSNNTDACTIIARFTRYKDTQMIMDRANLSNRWELWKHSSFVSDSIFVIFICLSYIFVLDSVSSYREITVQICVVLRWVHGSIN